MVDEQKLMERLRAYSARRKEAKGISIENIHGFDVSPDGGFELLLSDIDGALSMLDELQTLRAAVKQARIDALEEARADLAEALIHDCENGVKFLNEKAAEDFKKNFPHLRAAIESLKETP